jgi:hypothetical protein
VSERKIKSVPVPIKVGLVLTLLLLGLIIYFGTIHRCMLLESGALECRYNVEWLLDSPPNEIGDTIAGVFGTLAFVWIVVTVFLQSAELSAQREELSLTREELMLARVAQEKQLEVMQRQADIFDDERVQREQNRADALLTEHFESLMNFFRQNVGNHTTNLWFFELHEFQKKSYSSGFAKISDEKALIQELNLHSTPESFFPHYRAKFALKVSMYKALEDKQPLAGAFRHFIDEIRTQLQHALSLSPILSDAQRVRLASLGLREFAAEIDRLFQLIDEFEAQRGASQ